MPAQMPFASAGYQVWRNVMDYGAKGDGATDGESMISSQPQWGPRRILAD
jgi:hypothetical protein